MSSLPTMALTPCQNCNPTIAVSTFMPEPDAFLANCLLVEIEVDPAQAKIFALAAGLPDDRFMIQANGVLAGTSGLAPDPVVVLAFAVPGQVAQVDESGSVGDLRPALMAIGSSVTPRVRFLPFATIRA
jgi:hypothetical protein